MRYASDKSEAEDFLQEGFIRMFTKLNQYKFEGSFEGWVRRIMVNTSLEMLRKNANSKNYEEIGGLEYQLGEDENLISNLSTQELMMLIQELPPMYRAVFNLYVFEGYKHREIAEELGISDGTSKSNLSDARAILRKKVTNLYGLAK